MVPDDVISTTFARLSLGRNLLDVTSVLWLTNESEPSGCTLLITRVLSRSVLDAHEEVVAAERSVPPERVESTACQTVDESQDIPTVRWVAFRVSV